MDNYYFIRFVLLNHRAECQTRYENDCKDLGENHTLTKYAKQELQDAEKAVELFKEIRDQEDRK